MHERSSIEDIKASCALRLAPLKCKMLLVPLLIVSFANAEQRCDPAADQIILQKQKAAASIGIMTTAAGAPIEINDARETLNRRLIHNEFFMERVTHMSRERIPERLVHAKAAGGFGYFEVTHNITHICKAKLFSAIGKKTPIAARFSPTAVEKGGIDTSREARGFAVKFYTEEGNFDIVGLSTPMFIFRDPILFPAFVHAQKKNPATNLMDKNTFWDFLTLHPETFHILMLIFSDRGIPDGVRHMPGFSIHTYQVVNKIGQNNFIRFHFMPDAGVKNLKSDEAKRIAADDPDYAIRDLYRAIGNGEYPSWTVSIQVLTMKDVKTAGFDVFDVTKVLPLNQFPLIQVGRMVLNKNPINYFAEIEQLAFCPANLVPGILGAPDKLFEARRLSYRDAQYYRLGANFHKIHVNRPIRTVLTYNRDGRPPVKDNGKDAPNYYPNSFDGPEPYKNRYNKRDKLIEIYEEPPNNFEQAAEVYTNELDKDERTRLVNNLLQQLKFIARFLQNRAVKLFTLVHPDLGFRIKQGLALNGTEDNCECRI